MSKRTLERQKERAKKRAAKRTAMLQPGFESKYSKKRKYLHKHGLWGWEVMNPKPWK